MRKFLFSGFIGLLALMLAACGSTAAEPKTQSSSASSSGDSQLATTGQSYKFQFACISRTLDPCILLTQAGGFVDRVSERTNGQVEIQISSFPELGLAGPDTLRLVESGTLDFGEIYSGYVGGDLPIIDMANLWGLIPNNETNLQIIDAVREDMHRIISERSGGKVIGESYYPNNYYFAKKPLRTRDDFQGLKTRSHSTVLGDLIDGMGAEAQFVALSEVYTALERGRIDAAVSCGTCGSGLRWHEVSDYLVGPVIALGVTYLTMNQKRWDAIPADLQAIILEEAAKHTGENRRLVTTEWSIKGVDENVAAGMEYIEFTPELKDALRQASLTKVLPNWVERTGGPDSEAVRIYNEKVAPILKVRVNAEGQAEEIQ